MRHFFKRHLSKKDLQFLSTVIAKAESQTSGEIRVVLRHHRRWSERKLSIRDLALKEFHQLGMHKTTLRTGVLIFLLFPERKFQIIADEGIHTKVEDGTWDTIAKGMSSRFTAGNFRDGISEAIAVVGSVLSKAFPSTQHDRDELTNDIIEN